MASSNVVGIICPLPGQNRITCNPKLKQAKAYPAHLPATLLVPIYQTRIRFQHMIAIRHVKQRCIQHVQLPTYAFCVIHYWLLTLPGNLRQLELLAGKNIGIGAILSQGPIQPMQPYGKEKYRYIRPFSTMNLHFLEQLTFNRSCLTMI